MSEFRARYLELLTAPAAARTERQQCAQSLVDALGAARQLIDQRLDHYPALVTPNNIPNIRTKTPADQEKSAQILAAREETLLALDFINQTLTNLKPNSLHPPACHQRTTEDLGYIFSKPGNILTLLHVVNIPIYHHLNLDTYRLVPLLALARQSKHSKKVEAALAKAAEKSPELVFPLLNSH